MQRSIQSPGPLTPSHIPLPKYSLNRSLTSNLNGSQHEYMNGDNNNTEASRWKYKYEEAEKARKLLITKAERCK